MVLDTTGKSRPVLTAVFCLGLVGLRGGVVSDADGKEGS